ncbi:DEXH box helicase, DNA ligase-associated [Rubellimicrobium thermophilum DSM 16684]|uniref:DEXH box helicase, DNA ligase-associated n=1 Tax=Rubellimicrobium thermophilum DSM 16684 TaxID=1123069 RepID=S9QWR1_9RHOB|nr:ligase-associated DNA damage response DEXH box helicase [Rubellimicrobium thermophilum]EPX85841.1 DEXH box helicase, DNA ligase-associated [Rubellimicrobium thermophilum DSM 16684]
MDLPDPLHVFLARRGWHLHPHQSAMLEQARAPAILLVAPTGGGKTLAGFLPTLAELLADPRPGLHTLYVSPLRALTADIRRNLLTPVEELALPIRIEDRTGDTPQTVRRRQWTDPPQILLTTPESLALLLSRPDAARLFSGLQRVIVDEIHALAEGKRGDQLALLLSRIQTFAPAFRRVGLSATVEDPADLGRLLARYPDPCLILRGGMPGGADLSMLAHRPPPWAGGTALHAIPEVLDQIRRHRCTLIFHNTRAQAELFFHHLWMANEDALPIAIHHASLSREVREGVEGAMRQGRLRAVVCTGTLDMGLDWGAVDLVIQMGAPKQIKRLVQRMGRANHRAGARPRAILIPANRFEVLECVCAIEAAQAGELDGSPRGPGRSMCSASISCCGPVKAPLRLMPCMRRCAAPDPMPALSRADFDACLDFCATGGYALRAYDRWRRLMLRDGRWQLRDPRAARRIRLNLGTIEDRPSLAVRVKGSQTSLGQIEETFASTLSPGDTFLIGGQVVRFESLREMTVEVTRCRNREPRIASFGGGSFATSAGLARRILSLIGDTAAWDRLPPHTADWLRLQGHLSRLPRGDRLLVESFPAQGRWHAAFWGFAGRNAHQTLGLLLTRRMEAAGLDPLGFVAADHALLIWSLQPIEAPAALLDPEELREGFSAWLEGNALMKRTFRGIATIAGLIDRNLPGQRRTGRQTTVSSDILYDTLRRYDPGHLLLRVAREEALRGLVDFGRIEDMLARVQGRVDHVRLDRVPPLAAPLLLERGRVPVEGRGRERLAEAAAARLLEEAGLADLT